MTSPHLFQPEPFTQPHTGNGGSSEGLKDAESNTTPTASGVPVQPAESSHEQNEDVAVAGEASLVLDVLVGISFVRKPRKGYYAAMGAVVRCIQTGAFASDAILGEPHVPHQPLEEGARGDVPHQPTQHPSPTTEGGSVGTTRDDCDDGRRGWKVLPYDGCDQPLSWSKAHVDAVNATLTRMVGTVVQTSVRSGAAAPPTHVHVCIHVGSDTCHGLAQAMRLPPSHDPASQWAASLATAVEEQQCAAKPSVPPYLRVTAEAADAVDFEASLQTVDADLPQLGSTMTADLDAICNRMGISLPDIAANLTTTTSSSQEVPTALRTAAACVELLHRMKADAQTTTDSGTTSSSGDTLALMRSVNQQLVRSSEHGT